MATRKKTTVRKATRKKAATSKALAKRPSIPSNLALPGDLADQFADSINADRATAKAGSGWPFARTSGALITINGDPVPDPFEVIVLGAVRANAYYAEAYSGQSAFPDCFSVCEDGVEEAMAPPTDLKTKVSDSCNECEFNAWGSGQGAGKACRNQIRLAVLPWQKGLDYSEQGGAMVVLPPTSIKGWAQYTAKVVEGLGRPLFSVVTQLDKVANESGAGFRIEPSFIDAIQNRELLATLHTRAKGDARQALLALPQGGDGPARQSTERRRKVTRKRGGTR